MSKWDTRFMQMAKEVASWSKDPKAQVGAVAVSPDLLYFSVGYNGFPRGLADTADRLQSSNKNKWMIHAELNCIHNAPVKLTGWTMYVTKSPCVHCSLNIIQAGLASVVVPELDVNSRWFSEQISAQSLLREAGVNVHIYNLEMIDEYTGPVTRAD